MDIFSGILYILVFLSVYVQVFFLVTFFENRKKIIRRSSEILLKEYPGVTIIVPCWNEENTIENTVKSLLEMNYPKDKLKIMLIDDGSTDGTLSALNKFKNELNVKVFTKENGGKHTALNLGLENLETEYVGCLDADSFADSESLIRLMSYFENDATVMAVAPSVIVGNPKTIIQKAQKAEYYMSVYVKKMLGFMGAIHVTPGPLTIFRKKVFDDLGPYRHAHNTEDMEIAYRMQTNHYKIEQCNDAFVYTNTPSTVKTLYKQRLRWIYGFINNTIDYKKFLFKQKFGNFSLFTVPAGIVSIFAASYMFGRILYNLGDFIFTKFIEYSVVGFSTSSSLATKINSMDLFYFNTRAFIFLAIALYSMVFFSIIVGRKMASNRWGLSLYMLYFFPIYSVIAPFWLMKALFNTIRNKKPAWR